MLLIHSIAVVRISIPRQSQKLTSSSLTCTVANVILWHQDDVRLCPGRGVFKMFAVTCLSAPFYRYRKKELFKAIIVIKHAFLIHGHLLGPSEGVSDSGFNTSLAAQQMLMHRKPCLIPIISQNQVITELSYYLPSLYQGTAPHPCLTSLLLYPSEASSCS